MTERMSGAALMRAIKATGVRIVVALPDRTTSERVLKPFLRDGDVRVVQVCKEDEGVSICAGLHAAGRRAVLMMQYTGLLDSVNALRGVAVDGRNPVCMVVGMLNKEPGLAPKQSKFYGIRIVEPVIEALGIEHHLIEHAGDEAKVGPAIEKAYAEQKPVVFLVGTEPAP